MNNDDYVAFRVGGYLSSDLRLLFAAIGKCKVQWYTRLQMRFMVAAGAGPQWEAFSKGPGLTLRHIEKSPHGEVSMMADEPKSIAIGKLDRDVFAPRADRGNCTYCGGNDGDVPCAYPSEGKPGCLRDARLNSPPAGSTST